METYFMFGKYSAEAFNQISAQRTQDAIATIKSFGGEVIAMYALIGKYDLVFIVNFPELGQAMKASVALSRQTGITFTSSLAVSVEEFDKIIADIKK